MEDEDIKKEYAIYCIYNSGTPFILHTCKTLQDAKLQIYNLVAIEEDRHRAFFVDNDFYENKYPSVINGKYFKILERTIGDWEQYKEFKENIAQKQYSNNILQFKRNIS